MAADADAFAPLREFLTSETLSHFISEHEQWTCPTLLHSKTSTVGDAMELLARQGILSAAILDEEGEYLGAVSVPDVLRGLVRNLEANLGEGYLDNLSSVTAEELTALGTFFASKPAASVLHEADLWMKGDANTTLMSVLREGFQIEQTRVHHRIFVCDPAKASHHVTTTANGSGPAPTVVNIQVGSEREGASAWIPTDVVTQLDFVTLMVEKGLVAGVDASLEELGLAKTVVSTVTEDTPTLTVFHHMAMDLKSAVGITDASGKLVGSLSVADLRELPLDNFGLLLQPVNQLLANKTFPHARLDVVPGSISFAQLVSTLSAQRLHRVYVVDGEGHAQSIITLTDVLRVVSGCSIPKARRSLDIAKEHEDKKHREYVLSNGLHLETEAEEEEEEEQMLGREEG